MGKAPAISILITLLTAGLASADLAVMDRACAPGPRLSDTHLSLALSADTPARICSGIRPEMLETIQQRFLLDELQPEPALPQDRFDAMQGVPVSNLAASGLHGSFGSPFTDAAAASNPHENVIQLPPPPDGSMLTLSGLLTLAGFQLARSARNAGLAAILHVAYVPDWYHADATQVGHSVPFEFQPTLQPLQSVFSLIAPEPDRPAPRFYRPEAKCQIRSPQHTLLALAPRGPPAA